MGGVRADQRARRDRERVRDETRRQRNEIPCCRRLTEKSSKEKKSAPFTPPHRITRGQLQILIQPAQLHIYCDKETDVTDVTVASDEETQQKPSRNASSCCWSPGSAEAWALFMPPKLHPALAFLIRLPESSGLSESVFPSLMEV